MGCMITQIQTAFVYVSDYDRAKDFYVNKLGFDLQMDAPMGPDARWVQLAPKGAQTSLVLSKPMPGMPGYDEASKMVGGWAPFILAVDDMQKTYEELSGRGVEFQEAPAKQDWGWWAVFKDADGNTIGLHANP